MLISLSSCRWLPAHPALGQILHLTAQGWEISIFQNPQLWAAPSEPSAPEPERVQQLKHPALDKPSKGWTKCEKHNVDGFEDTLPLKYSLGLHWSSWHLKYFKQNLSSPMDRHFHVLLQQKKHNRSSKDGSGELPVLKRKTVNPTGARCRARPSIHEHLRGELSHLASGLQRQSRF